MEDTGDCPALGRPLPADTPPHPGVWDRSFPLAGSLILTLNRDPDWPLFYSLVGAVTSGQLLCFPPETLIVSQPIGHFLECTDPFQEYNMLFYA